MRIDLLPKMQTETLLSRSGDAVDIYIELVEHQGLQHVFMREQHRFSDSSIASNAMAFVEQLLERYQLDPNSTHFYRYVFTSATGALFGRFSIDWEDGAASSYSFKMLNQQEAQQQLLPIIEYGRSMIESIELGAEAPSLDEFSAALA